MSVLEEILGAFSPGHALEHGGKRFVFNRIDQRTKSALGAAYFERARDGVYQLKDLAGDEQYDRMLTRLADGYRRGDFAFPGSGESMAYYLGEGLPELTRHLTGCTQEEAEALCMDRSLEVLHVVLCCTADSFPQVKKKMLQGARDGDPQMAQLAAMLAPAA